MCYSVIRVKGFRTRLSPGGIMYLNLPYHLFSLHTVIVLVLELVYRPTRKQLGLTMTHTQIKVLLLHFSFYVLHICM